MQTLISRKHCKECAKKTKHQKNKPSVAFGIVTGSLSFAQTDRSWHCSECGNTYTVLHDVHKAIKAWKDAKE